MYLLFLARCVLGAVFIFASLEKITAPEAFAVSVEAYRLLPFSAVNLFALFIPWLELVCGVLLMAGYHVRGSSLSMSILLFGFTLAILSAMARHLNIDCGCFGAAYQTPVGWARVFEDLGLLILGVYIFRFSSAGRVPAEAGAPAVQPGSTPRE